MNRLVLAFGIFCLLQGLSAEPKPGFGVKNTLPATNKITSVNGDIRTISSEIGALTVGAITSDMIQLLFVKTKLETIILYVDRNLKAITASYDTLVAATDNNIYINFEPFLRAIDDTVTFATEATVTMPSGINGVKYSGISDELADVFARLIIGLTDLKAKTEAAKEAITVAVNAETIAPVNGEITVNAGTLRQYVTLQIMNNLLNSFTKVRTYLPLMRYVLQTVIENLVEADAYVNSIKTALDFDVVEMSASLTADIETFTTAVEDSVAAEFLSGYNAMVTIDNNVANGGAVKEWVTSFRIILDTDYRTEGKSMMENAFDHISTALAELIVSLKNAVSVTENSLLNMLIDTLMGNDAYGRYCCNKYKDLVKGLFDLSFDAGWMCVDKERERFEHLQSTLALIIEQLAYDYEDFVTQAGICNTLATYKDGNIDSSFKTNTCIDALETNYADLFVENRNKIDLVYTIASDEAVASEKRLLMCFNLVSLDMSVTQAEAIKEGLTSCSVYGPTGPD